MGASDVVVLRRLAGARTAVTAANAKLAERITRSVGTMACAYAFSVLGGIGVAAALTNNTGVVLIVGSISGYFLQLVLLPVIMVGQNAQGARTESVILDTHTEVTELLHAIHGEVVPGSPHAP